MEPFNYIWMLNQACKEISFEKRKPILEKIETEG